MTFALRSFGSAVACFGSCRLVVRHHALLLIRRARLFSIIRERAYERSWPSELYWNKTSATVWSDASVSIMICSPVQNEVGLARFGTRACYSFETKFLSLSVAARSSRLALLLVSLFRV